ncbi:hypothetical protein HK099_003178, partial [Clydaea vesicula]
MYICTFLFLKGISDWLRSNSSDKIKPVSKTPQQLPEELVKAINATSDEPDFQKKKYFIYSEIDQPFSTESRPFFFPIVIFLLSHLIGCGIMLLPWKGSYFVFASIFTTIIGTKLVVPLIIQLIETTTSAKQRRQELSLLKSFICTELSLALSS